jgi:transcriptional regulator with XRE-family HTH domain
VKVETASDHIRRRRLTLKLLQRQVAEQLGVDKTSIYNWEGNRAKPGLEYMPAIIRFLGYNPLPPADGWADRLVQCRTVLGLSQKESAHRIGVDPCTLARWERGEREPTGSFAARALRFLTGAEAMWSQGAAQTA